MPPLQKTIYTGTFIYTPTLGSLSISEHLAIGVDEEGVIRHITDLLPNGQQYDQSDVVNETKRVKAAAVKWGWGETGWKLIVGGKKGRSWWFPGFVANDTLFHWKFVFLTTPPSTDTHIHASQHPNIGLFGKTTLLDWLTTYTYPLESSLRDPTKARKVYSNCVSRLLSHGTTTAAYFATAHAASTNILATTCLLKGQRAFIGRVCMDTPLSPPSYRDPTPTHAITETLAVIAHIATIDPTHTLLTPILTPRFAPSCSAPLLSALGSLATSRNLPIQTHIAENPSECALVSQLFPACPSYAHVYAAHNLLTPRTVLAHAIHLSPAERALVREKGCSIAHCPVSNTALSSGLCPVRTLLDEGVTVGLGTDVSGGYSASVLVAAREACMVSRTLAALMPEEDNASGDMPVLEKGQKLPSESSVKPKMSVKDRTKLSVEEVLYLATRGGAACLGLSERVGAFEVGMEWDAQLIVVGEAGDGVGKSGVIGQDEGPVELWGEETWEEKVAKWVFCGDDRNTKMVFVRGVSVHQRS